MLHDPKVLESIISRETGLDFEVSSGKNGDGNQVISLLPKGYLLAHTFTIEVTIEWRRLKLNFVPGNFAGSLLQEMSEADDSGRSVFKAILEDCERLGAKIVVSPNNVNYHFEDENLWNDTWRQLSFQLSKGNIELGTEDGTSDSELVQQWTVRFTAAVVSLLPLEEQETGEIEGFPEGAIQKINVNRYERDRRNRAAALAIHGNSCLACGMDFGKMYGPSANGFIEVHHVVPVSELGVNYVINPKDDLIPLCPNCHAVAHRRNPPFEVTEIKELLTSSH